MIVNLTQEQIDFIEGLCHSVKDDYDAYSRDEQIKREKYATDIIFQFENSSENIDEEKLNARAYDYCMRNGYSNLNENDICNDTYSSVINDIMNAYKSGFKDNDKKLF